MLIVRVEKLEGKQTIYCCDRVEYEPGALTLHGKDVSVVPGREKVVLGRLGESIAFDAPRVPLTFDDLECADVYVLSNAGTEIAKYHL
jgi:hypothetical protein